MSGGQQFDRLRTAAIVIEALGAGLDPSRVLSEILGIHRQAARARYRRVKEEGFLGVPPHEPVKVFAHRQSVKLGKAAVWMACLYCHHPWPCEGGFPYGIPTQFQEKHPMERTEGPQRGRPRRLRRPPIVEKGAPRIP